MNNRTTAPREPALRALLERLTQVDIIFPAGLRPPAAVVRWSDVRNAVMAVDDQFAVRGAMDDGAADPDSRSAAAFDHDTVLIDGEDGLTMTMAELRQLRQVRQHKCCHPASEDEAERCEALAWRGLIKRDTKSLTLRYIPAEPTAGTASSETDDPAFPRNSACAGGVTRTTVTAAPSAPHRYDRTARLTPPHRKMESAAYCAPTIAAWNIDLAGRPPKYPGTHVTGGAAPRWLTGRKMDHVPSPDKAVVVANSADAPVNSLLPNEAANAAEHAGASMGCLTFAARWHNGRAQVRWHGHGLSSHDMHGSRLTAIASASASCNASAVDTGPAAPAISAGPVIVGDNRSAYQGEVGAQGVATTSAVNGGPPRLAEQFGLVHASPTKVAHAATSSSAMSPPQTDEVASLAAEVARLNALINTPQANDFIRAVSMEAEHQRQRWGSSHDAGKSPADWYWLVGHLAGKALHAACASDKVKAEHHIITTAAALANWHLALFGRPEMRPGSDAAATLAAAAE